MKKLWTLSSCGVGCFSQVQALHCVCSWKRCASCRLATSTCQTGLRQNWRMLANASKNWIPRLIGWSARCVYPHLCSCDVALFGYNALDHLTPVVLKQRCLLGCQEVHLFKLARMILKLLFNHCTHMLALRKQVMKLIVTVVNVLLGCELRKNKPT